jgi:DNA-binding SARP family transcriptional activator
MAEAQARAAYDYYAAISLHNAAIAQVSSGNFREALRLGAKALEAFNRMKSGHLAAYSTHAVLAACEFELGRQSGGHEELRVAVSTGEADGDVHAACAFALAVIGQHNDSLQRLAAADRRHREGRSDLSGGMIAGFTRAGVQLGQQPDAAMRVLEALPDAVPLDLELHLQHKSLLCVARLMAGHVDKSIETAEGGIAMAVRRGGRRFEVRMNLTLALAKRDAGAFISAVAEAASVGDMALLEVADAIGEALHLVPSVPSELALSIANWPARWLPVLRRQLAAGDMPNARAAALLLDSHGTIADIGLLRAYDKTYRKRSRTAGLGRGLARRVSPKLQLRDLGRVALIIGDREVPLTAIRRKPASLLMYLVTRPKFTATREQVLDALWPDNDPAGATNSLNQSLYFIRREIDPWYEDGVSADYLCYEGEILWLDAALICVASAEFVAKAGSLLAGTVTADEAHRLIDSYHGQFSPEFEYEEWASTWRTRVHAAFLSFATTTIDDLATRADLTSAVALAQQALVADPGADELERKLVWLYWRTGAASAAMALYGRLTSMLES